MRIGRLAAGVAVLALLAEALPASPPQYPPAQCCQPVAPVWGMNDLVRMSRADLEALYRAAEVGSAPTGYARGLAIYKPGSWVTGPASRVVHVMWQGKYFKDDGTMVNRIFGLRAIHARVYVGESWFDGRPSLILDYCGTSRLFADVRDEVREVCPGLYLGLNYHRKDTGPELKAFFALDARPQAHRPSLIRR